MILSKRLEKIISLVDKNKSVIDIGTDHALVPIELYRRGISKDIYGTDISSNVCRTTINHINELKLNNVIKIALSDGFKKINRNFDIAIIAGMGTISILKILKDCNNLPNILILSSHNDHGLLRENINKMGYKIIIEDVVFENNKYYPIIKYQKGREVLTDEEVLFGKSNNKNYYIYLLNKYQKLLELSKKEIYQDYIAKLKNIIEKTLD